MLASWLPRALREQRRAPAAECAIAACADKRRAAAAQHDGFKPGRYGEALRLCVRRGCCVGAGRGCQNRRCCHGRGYYRLCWHRLRWHGCCGHLWGRRGHGEQRDRIAHGRRPEQRGKQRTARGCLCGHWGCSHHRLGDSDWCHHGCRRPLGRCGWLHIGGNRLSHRSAEARRKATKRPAVSLHAGYPIYRVAVACLQIDTTLVVNELLTGKACWRIVGWPGQPTRALRLRCGARQNCGRNDRDGKSGQHDYPQGTGPEDLGQT